MSKQLSEAASEHSGKAAGPTPVTPRGRLTPKGHGYQTASWLGGAWDMTSVWSPLMLVLPKNLLSFRATMDYYDYQHLLSTECLWSKQKRQHLHRQEAGKHATCGLGRGYISFYSPWSPHTSYKPTYSFPTRVREVLGPSRAAKVWDVGGGCLATGPESGYFISTLFYFHRVTCA